MICKTCNSEKELSEFYFRKDSQKYRSECKVCFEDKKSNRYLKNRNKIRKYQKKYYEKNKKNILKCVKKYAEANKEKIKERGKIYREKNKELIAFKKKKYAQENAEKLAEYQRKYREKNKDKLRERARVVRAKRRKEDVGYRILQNCRKRIYDALNGKCKSKKTLSLLGCSIEEYKIYLESKFQYGMSWENYGRGGWCIDHICPCSKFDLSDPEQQKKCFHYLNTQPLWENENITKGDK
jgi:septum formation topological specificity factor MinE